MSEPLFGTDGIRGRFGEPPLVESTVTALGGELGSLLRESTAAPLAVIGGDTRPSTPTIAGWIAAGLTSRGVDIRHLGVVPTPAVAWAVRHLDAAVGVVVSASHNPHPDNGVKLFDEGGRKWSTEAERRLEDRLDGGEDGGSEPVALEPDTATVRAYSTAVAATVPDDALDGLDLVLDTAHGAASPYAEPLYAARGATVRSLHADSDGTGINAGCGSTDPTTLQRAVVDTGADIGIAFDGDADRALLVDETGALVDGDAMLWLWATDLRQRGALDPPVVVATTMSNIGLERALRSHGIELVRCGVGDREVAKTMTRTGAVLGGEQSGHIIHAPASTTGDGMLTGLQLAAIVRRRDRALSELVAELERSPQLLVNVEVASKPPLSSLAAVATATRRVEEELGADGRLLVRYSGTEPVARIMIEGPDRIRLEQLSEEVASALRTAIGG